MTSMVFLPILSDILPATELENTATTKITENKLPACISERERVSLISGREIPRIATVMDGIRLALDAIATVDQSYFESFGTTAMLGKLLFFQYNPFGVRSRMDL